LRRGALRRGALSTEKMSAEIWALRKGALSTEKRRNEKGSAEI